MVINNKRRTYIAKGGCDVLRNVALRVHRRCVGSDDAQDTSSRHGHCQSSLLLWASPASGRARRHLPKRYCCRRGSCGGSCPTSVLSLLARDAPLTLGLTPPSAFGPRGCGEPPPKFQALPMNVLHLHHPPSPASVAEWQVGMFTGLPGASF